MPFESLTGRAFYRACHWGSFFGFTFGLGFRVAGREHLPATGPVLLLSNHQSMLDPVLVGAGAPWALTYLARSTLWNNKWLARIIDWWGAVPIDRGFGKEGLQTVLAELDKGRKVVMFPEGERTHTGELQPLKPGVTLLLKRVQCPVIPVGLDGAFDLLPRTARFPRLDPLCLLTRDRCVALTFGPAIDPAVFALRDRDEMLERIFEAIRSAHAVARRLRQ